MKRILHTGEFNARKNIFTPVYLFALLIFGSA